MTTDRASGLVLTSLTVTAALAFVKDAATKSKPEMRWVIGTLMAGAGLAVLAQITPDLAAGLALLMLLSAAIVYGKPAWDAISAATKTDRTK